MSPTLEQAVRDAGGRVRAALAARFRDLDLAEEAFAEACVAALPAWAEAGPPRDPAAWLYKAALRRALDLKRRAKVRAGYRPDPRAPEPTPEEALIVGEDPIPDERLRLIFVCCHPAVGTEARAALTLRLVCGLSTAEIAAAFLVSEPALAQRIVRAKRKIADAGVPFETPGPDAWPERMDAVLSTLEVAYAKAYEDAAGAGAHADFYEEVLRLSGLLARLAPGDGEALSFAAMVRFTEARRPARLDDDGAMIPLDQQDPAQWRHDLIDEGERLLKRAAACARRPGPRALQAAIHCAHCVRRRGKPTPWPAIVGLYDALLEHRPDAVVRLNRAVALAETAGVEAGLAEVEALAGERTAGWLPWHAARAHLLARLGRAIEAAAAFDAALALNPAPAERLYLERRRAQAAPAAAASPSAA
ncbi:MAG TPA: DUF6596 domain-containing protein [Caulobacteraceae bacterium]|nr:DUF6596 domain-containing protein [Caulobacteraceae bacterium]